MLRGPLSFWSYVPWIESPRWQPRRVGYLESFQLILARCHANVSGSFDRTILHDVMGMGFHDGASGWITEDEALAFAVTLLDAGARTGVRDGLLKSTPLGWACRLGRTAIVKELYGVTSIRSSRTRSRGPRRARGRRRWGIARSPPCSIGLPDRARRVIGRFTDADTAGKVVGRDTDTTAASVPGRVSSQLLALIQSWRGLP